MTIGIDVSQIVYEGTGVSRYTLSLVETLLKIDRNNEYVLFGASLGRFFKLKELTKNLRCTKYFFPIPISFLEFVWNKWHILPIEKWIGKIDVFHCSDWTEPPGICPKVTTIHDLVVYKFPETSHPKIVSTQKRKLEWALKDKDNFIAVSQSTKRDLVEILKVKENFVSVIYEAAGENFQTFMKHSIFEKNKLIDALRSKYGLNKKYILTLGTREPRKNLKRLINAWSKFKIADVDLVVVGKYGWGNDVEADVVNIKLLGYVPDEFLPQLYSGAELFVFPSLYEGFGLPVLEAMSVGCPVITSNVSSLPEVGGGAAIYIDPYNFVDIQEKIRSIINLNSKERLNLQNKLVKQAENFTWEKTAKQTIAQYEKIVH